jgi:hypothetical protein
MSCASTGDSALEALNPLKSLSFFLELLLLIFVLEVEVSDSVGFLSGWLVTFFFEIFVFVQILKVFPRLGLRL